MKTVYELVKEKMVHHLYDLSTSEDKAPMFTPESFPSDLDWSYKTNFDNHIQEFRDSTGLIHIQDTGRTWSVSVNISGAHGFKNDHPDNNK